MTTPRRLPLTLGLLLGLLGASLTAQAGDAKRGKVYFRMVCTVCHMEKAGGPIAPNSRTKAEWSAYLQANKHAKGKDAVSHYASAQYRSSIKAGNKAAEKYADVPEATLLDDIRTFVVGGAKDSDTPTSCD